MTNVALFIFLPVSTLLLLFVAIIWSNNGIQNILFKVVYWIVTFLGVILTYEYLLRSILFK